MIYRGWGIMTLVTPIAGILLLAYFFPHDGAKGNIPLQQVLLGGGIGAAVNMLLGLYDAAERVVADAQAIQVPTQLLISGSDFVVHRKPQQQFFDRLGSLIAQFEG